jgi:GT2 family glycosyltransferase
MDIGIHGIFSPLIKGGVGNPEQSTWEVDEALGDMNFSFTERTLCFPCVYIPRPVIDAVGLLDEDFILYGFDDDNYCDRARINGFDLVVLRSLYIQHGDGREEMARGKNWSCSFATLDHVKTNQEIYLKKKLSYPKS